MEKLKNFFLSKPVAFFFLLGAIIYGGILPFCWGNDPFDEYGTLSILCEDRKIFFWIWVFFVGGGYLINTNFAYKKYNENSKFLRILSFITLLACCGIAITLGHPVDSWNPKRVIHWIATGLYILTVGLSVGLFVLKNIKKYKGFPVLLVCVIGVVALIPIWLLVFGKSSMMELVPNFLFQILLIFMNFTNLFKKKEIE